MWIGKMAKDGWGGVKGPDKSVFIKGGLKVAKNGNETNNSKFFMGEVT